MPGNSPFVSDNYNTLVVAFRKDPFIRIGVVSFWRKIIKRAIDVAAAFTGLILLLPLLIYIAIRIKLDSKGSIFYFQERVGHRGVTFTILKFRSMYEDAETGGPALSYPNDKRITKWGSTMRKWKLDELPQLYNVLINDMSLVGPRPERKYYIDLVSSTYPYFEYLQQVKPGLTSLGMIKFGYAHSIDQIIQRMKYDISYVNNYSLFLDIKILFYTVPAIIEGKLFTPSFKIGAKYQPGKLRSLN